MKKLLKIDCSSRTEGSHSREMADYFEKKWQSSNPDGEVIYRDLITEPLPHIHNDTITGFYTPPKYMTESLLTATALSDKLIAELKSVDEILISSPLYNLNVPSNLKAYIDQIVRVGHTFNIDQQGVSGLLKNKSAYLITVKGGSYKGTPMEAFDFQESYLKTLLNYIGVQVKQVFSLEGASDENLIHTNKTKLKELIKSSL